MPQTQLDGRITLGHLPQLEILPYLQVVWRHRPIQIIPLLGLLLGRVSMMLDQHPTTPRTYAICYEQRIQVHRRVAVAKEGQASPGQL